MSGKSGELLKDTAFEYGGKFKTAANEIAKTHPNGERGIDTNKSIE